MLNERIVASGIYYYEEENISESRLAFRATTDAPVYHEQDDVVCMEILYGLKRLQVRVALLRGPTPTSTAFPHSVSLTQQSQDTGKFSHFLIDPSIDPIPSATNIPPQQSEWVFDALEDARRDPKPIYSRLPPEISNLILDNLPDTSMTRDEAEEYRLKLMKERTGFTQNREEELSYSFNMCKH
ncbi:hypothetical protein B0H13DRAFT_2487921 [Mycena leptocephala]|nr:hypothetical protein B0H13DRAFT_2487921 [Mycena leptocephala]